MASSELPPPNFDGMYLYFSTSFKRLHTFLLIRVSLHARCFFLVIYYSDSKSKECDVGVALDIQTVSVSNRILSMELKYMDQISHCKLLNTLVHHLNWFKNHR